MKLLVVTNLFPRPDRPQAGRFNVQLRVALGRSGVSPESPTLCLVPEWRCWRWSAIRRWVAPASAPSSVAVTYRPVWYAPLIGRDWNAVTYAWSLDDLRDRARVVDAVLVPWLYPDGAAVVRALGADCRTPVWLMALGSDTLHLRHALRRPQVVDACRRAAGVVCVGRRLADRLTSAGVPAARVHVVPNGVDTDRFRYRPATEFMPLLESARPDLHRLLATGSTGARLVLFVGNLVAVKGPDLLLAAFAACTRETNSPPPWLLIIGTGPMQAALMREAERLGVVSRVVFAGNCPHEEVALWMNRADVLVLSSRSEGMPNVVLEALASGLPVVATDVGDCAEMLAGEALARVVPPGEASTLARALGELLETTPDRPALARRHGRRSWDDQARELLNLMAGAS